MARSTRGLYKRGDRWWMTYRDAVGRQRFESCRTTNKKEAEQHLIDRRKETMEGLLPTAPIQPLALEALKDRYLAFVGHQRGVPTKRFTSPTSRVCGAIRPFIPSQWKSWTSTEPSASLSRWALGRSIGKWRRSSMR